MAIRILEIAKYLFNVKGICFIVTMNKSSLISTVKSVYGLDDNQSLEYLERFFDFQFRLPEPSIDKYAESLLEKHIKNF